MIANYRVPSDLSSLESTTDGYSVVLGMCLEEKNCKVALLSENLKRNVKILILVLLLYLSGVHGGLCNPSYWEDGF